MNFDWTTFALEVLNFLVLVWLLKHFFYQPVLAVIAQRRVEGEKAQAAAQALGAEAESLKAECQARLAALAQEHDRAMAQLESDVALERARRLAAVEVEVNAERERRQALNARAAQASDAEHQRQALGLAVRFATRLLERVASPALESALIDLALSEISRLAPDQWAALHTALVDAASNIEVVTAYPVSAPQQAALTAALTALAGNHITPSFAEDAQLKAGLRIHIGAWLLKLNLQDELEFFSGNLSHGD